ncbi:hypothetical protein ACRRTK_015711 [Alexandromys fortis]
MQESMILSAVVSSFPEAMVIGAEVYQNLKKVIKEKYRKSSINVSNEDIKFAPNTLENKEAPEVLKNAIAKASYTVISIEAVPLYFPGLVHEKNRQFCKTNNTEKPRNEGWLLAVSVIYANPR